MSGLQTQLVASGDTAFSEMDTSSAPFNECQSLAVSNTVSHLDSARAIIEAESKDAAAFNSTFDSNGHVGPVTSSGSKASLAFLLHDAPKSRPRPTIAPLPSRFTHFLPPLNYGAVEPGVMFRSAFPAPDSYDSLKQLRIATIVTLVEDIPESYQDFLIENQIRHFKFPVPANKDGTISTGSELIDKILRVVLNRHYYPLLIHCNRGKHRTGCVVGCLRKVQSYNNSYAIKEYEDYAFPKARTGDVSFIKSYDPERMRNYATMQGWVSPSHSPTPDCESGDEQNWNPKKDSATALNFDQIAKIELPKPVDGEMDVDVADGDDEGDDGNLEIGRSRGSLMMLTDACPEMVAPMEDCAGVEEEQQQWDVNVQEMEVDSADDQDGSSTPMVETNLYTMPISER